MTETITIKGKEYPIHISHKAIKAWRIMKRRHIHTLDQEPGDFEALIMEGVKVGCKDEKVKFDLKMEDIDDWLDEDMTSHMKLVSDMIARAFPEQIVISLEMLYRWLKEDESRLDGVKELIKDGVPDEFPESLKN